MISHIRSLLVSSGTLLPNITLMGIHQFMMQWYVWHRILVYRYPLVDGHGNFGSIDGDGAAAMRYTEARMSKLAMEMMRDINKNTIDFRTKLSMVKNKNLSFYLLVFQAY